MVVVVALCIPCLGLGYMWDDYYFLTFHGGTDFRAYLLPNAQAAFYRPISQGLYFLLLLLVDPAGGTLAHVVNLAALGGAITLLVLLVSRLSGWRAGLISGLVFASLGCTASLVAWVSCSQDLLAIAFVLWAFLLRDHRKDLPALASATAAVLCKEPAIAAFPVLVFWDRIVGRPSSRLPFQVIGYGLVATLWLLIHPGIHLLAGRGFQSGATGYVGIDHPERWGRYLLRYALTLVNLPPPGFQTSWGESRILCGVIALGVLIGGLVLLDRGRSREEPARALSLGRIASMAALFAVPTLLMPVVLIRHWAPYFACIPAIGMAILAGPLLARQRPLAAGLLLGVFLLLGLRYRGLEAGAEPVWSEKVFAYAADAVRRVDGNFHYVIPYFPKGTQVCVSVETTGARGIRSTLLDGQALRVWYRDRSLSTVDVLKRRPGATADYLVRVTTDLDVIWIDPNERRIKASHPEAADITGVGRPLRNYARAVAAGGDTDRAIRIMEWLDNLESGWGRVYCRRLMAMIYLNAGRRKEAADILAVTPAFPKETALGSVRRLLAEPSESEGLDNAAFEAFGLSESDPETIRWVMREFVKDGATAQAAWYAQRLLQFLPGDQESGEVIRGAKRLGIEPRRDAT